MHYYAITFKFKSKKQKIYFFSAQVMNAQYRPHLNTELAENVMP